MFRKPNNDSLVYKILITLINKGTIILMNDYTMRISYDKDLGILRIKTPVRIIINRMFKLKDECINKVTPDINLYSQEYILDTELLKESDNLLKLKAHYESEYLRFR